MGDVTYVSEVYAGNVEYVEDVSDVYASLLGHVPDVL
jgi:hypothetical protein